MLIRFKNRVSYVNAYPRPGASRYPIVRWIEPGDVFEEYPAIGAGVSPEDFEELPDPRDDDLPDSIEGIGVSCGALLSWLQSEHGLSEHCVGLVIVGRLADLVEAAATLQDAPPVPFGVKEVQSVGSVPEAVTFTKRLRHWAAEAASTSEAKSDVDVEQQMERVAQAVGDDNAVRILAIAHRRDWSGERRMEEILRLDNRYAGKDSNEWGTLLGVSAAAVRGYSIWKRIQRAKGSDD